jgi:hypothetical protein
MKGVRYADQWFKTKKEGQAAEAKRKEELANPKPVDETTTPTDITFCELSASVHSANFFQTRRRTGRRAWYPAGGERKRRVPRISAPTEHWGIWTECG